METDALEMNEVTVAARARLGLREGDIAGQLAEVGLRTMWVTAKQSDIGVENMFV